MRPSRVLPPVEFWRGVRPRKAANSRPLAKTPASWIVIGIAGVYDAGGEPVGEAKPLLHLAQRQNAAIRRKQTAIKFDHDRLPARRRQTRQWQHGIVHDGWGLTEIARIGFDNQILRDIRHLSYIRQPAAHNPGSLLTASTVMTPTCQAGP